MYHYQEAISRALVEQKEIADSRTIPEELFLTVHPKVLYEEMPQILEDCEAMQKKVLEEILYLAKDSVYAREHGLAQVETLEQWRQTAVLSTYADYQPYIEAALAGAEEQLYTGKTALYIATTGSTGKMKYFLESEAGNAAKQLIMAVRGMYMSALLPVTLDMNAKNLTISNYAPVGNGPDGKLIVRASGQTARNMRKKTGTMNILPVEFWEAPGISARDRDYMMAVYALAEVRLSKIFCNNVIHFGRILNRIQSEGQQMIADIRCGEFSVPLLPEVRERLAATFFANPQRAEALQKIYQRQGCLIIGPADIAEIWPDCSMISCWLSATVGRDAREVLRRLPKYVKCFDLGYGASESKLNIPTKLGSAAGVVAPFACFYEFLPLGGENPLCMWEVADGQHYELLITTYSGLYRYNLQDIVRIDGFIGNTPNITFCGKSSEFITIQDKKIYGYQLTDLVYRAEKELGVEFDLVQIFAEADGFYYVLESKTEIDYAALKHMLDTASRQEFDIVSKGIYVMQHEYKDHLFTQYTREDRGACGIKLPVVLKEGPAMQEIKERI